MTEVSGELVIRPDVEDVLLTPILGLVGRWQTAVIWHGLRQTLEQQEYRP